MRGTGRVLLEPRYDRADVFDGDLAEVEIDDKTGWVDRTGRFVWEPTK